MREYIVSGGLMLLLLSSCDFKKEHRNKDYGAIEISEKKDSIATSFVEKIEYLSLELNKDYPIGEVKKVILNDTCIYIMDTQTQSIFIYGKSGNFIKVIANHGKGPREFLNVMDFKVFDNNLYVLVNRSKLYVYDLDGNWIKEIALDNFYADEFQITKESILLISNYGQVDSKNERYSVRLCSRDGKVVEKLLPYEEEFRCVQRSMNNQSSCLDNKFSVMLPYNNVLYSIEGNKIKETHLFNSDYKTLTIDLINNEGIKDQEDIFRIEKIFDVLNFIETSNLTIIQYKVDGILYTSSHTKATKKTSTFRNDKFYFPEHLSVLPEIIGCHENALIAEIPSYVATIIKEKDFTQKLHPKLKEIIEITDDFSNPILAFYYLK